MTYIGKIQLSAPAKIPFDFLASFEQFENKDFYNLAVQAAHGISDNAVVEFECAFGKYHAIAMEFVGNTRSIKFVGANK